MSGEVSRLWSLLPHPPGTVIRWMAKQGTQRVVGDFAATEKELQQAVTAFRHGWNFYVAPNPATSRVGTRHSAGEVSHWSWFLIDMDPQEEKPEPMLALGKALGALEVWWGGSELAPLVIDSGRGAQAWLRLPDVALDAVTRSRVSKAQRHWLHRLDEALGMVNGCRVDTTVSDLPRVMRCPGTVNQKTMRETRIMDPGLAHSQRVVERIMDLPEEVFFEPEPSGDIAGKPWQYAITHLTRKARTFLESGWQEPGRHEALWHTAKKLQEVGVSRDEATKALHHGNDMCRDGIGERAPLSPNDVQHALNTAYGRS